jgi:hypothetical protein
VGRELYLSPTLHGTGILNGTFDAEATEMLASAIDAAIEITRFEDDLRSRAQQRADALVELVKVGIAHFAQGPGRRTQPHVSLVVDLELLEARGGSDLVRQVRGEAEHVGALSKATLKRLTCDCSIARVVTQGGSLPLDVGRATRTIPPAIWRALVARDRGCVHPGCDRPPGWCEGHHIVHWEDGGPTSLENLELRCWRHHQAVHEGGRAPNPSTNPYEC